LLLLLILLSQAVTQNNATMSKTSSKHISAMEMDYHGDKSFPRVPANVSHERSVKERTLNHASSDNLSNPVHKTVNFADESYNQDIMPSGPLMEEDCAAMYMTDADQRRIFLDISKTIRRARVTQREDCITNDPEAGTPLMEQDEGIRGLESIIQHNSTRSKRMRASVVAILDRQLTHRIDESWLNGFYRPLVRESKTLARYRAVCDEVEANNVHMTTTRSSTSSISTTTITKDSHERRGTKRVSTMVLNRITRKRKR
jgi:hypothetical protein